MRILICMMRKEICNPRFVCFSEFDDLFEAFDDEAVTVVKWNGQFTHDGAVARIQELHKELDVSVLVKSPRQFLLETTFNISAHSLQQADLVFYWTASSHGAGHVNCDEYMRLKNKFYRSLRPSTIVSSVLRQLSDARGWRGKFQLHSTIPSASQNSDGVRNKGMSASRELVVGVHVRSHDAQFDWAVVPPDVSVGDLSSRFTQKSKSAVIFDDSTPLDVVKSAMKDILERHPGVLFVVASNSNIVKDTLLKQFGDAHVLTLLSPNEQSSSRNKVAGMQLALLEFYVLGMASDLIIHTKGSSFAAEASFLNINGPLPVVDMTVIPSRVRGTVPVNIYKHDKRLAFCGMDDFYNVHMDQMAKQSSELQKQKFCYLDDVTGSAEETPRLLCTHIQRLKKCDLTKDTWGINGLYCMQREEFTVDHVVTCSELDFHDIDGATTSNGPDHICMLTDSRGY